MPEVNDIAETLLLLYTQKGMPDAIQAFDGSRAGISDKYRTAMWARAYRGAGDDVKAESILVDLLEQEPDYRRGLDELMTLYIQQKNIGAMIDRLKTWLENNPRDLQIAQALRELEAQIEGLKDTSSDSL